MTLSWSINIKMITAYSETIPQFKTLASGRRTTRPTLWRRHFVSTFVSEEFRNLLLDVGMPFEREQCLFLLAYFAYIHVRAGSTTNIHPIAINKTLTVKIYSAHSLFAKCEYQRDRSNNSEVQTELQNITICICYMYMYV